MPRPPAPIERLKLKGTLTRDPMRYAHRYAEPVPKLSIGFAPKCFTKELAAIWNELRAQSLPGVLGNSDRQLVELTCILIEKSRANDINVAERGQLLTCLTYLGMTPSHRTKVAVDPALAKKATQDSPFASFTAPPLKTGTNG
jgi:hypothetical protein